jgi:hypothetical protein
MRREHVRAMEELKKIHVEELRISMGNTSFFCTHSTDSSVDA